MARSIKALPLLLVLFVLPLFAFTPREGEKSISELIEEISRNRDESEVGLLTQLANFKNGEAAQGLVDLFDKMGSIYMRREVLRALEVFDGVDDGQQVALQKMLDIATNSDDRELRGMALDSIAACSTLGKAYLENVVESPAEDDIRETAMKFHLQLASEADFPWYEKLYDPDLVKEAREDQKKGGKKKKKKGADEEEPELMVHSVPKIRAMAFERIATTMTIPKIIEATKDKQWRIRMLAVDALNQKDPQKVISFAEDSLGKNTHTGTERAAAAAVLVERQGMKAAGELLDIAGKSPDVVKNELRFAIADLLADLGDDKFKAKLAKLVGKGNAHDKLFALRVNAQNMDEKVTKAMRKGLKDKNRDVKLETIRMLGERKDTESLAAIRKAMGKEKKDKEALAVYLQAIGNIEGNDKEFIGELNGYVSSENRDLRNTAIELLAKISGKKHVEVFETALTHEQWDTRLSALRALEETRNRDSVGKIIEQMKNEGGRLLHEFAETLFNLTGQPYGKSFGGWESWWKNEGKGLDLISASEHRKRTREEEDRRLKKRSKASFFGIKIISKRVIFIIDISGSMNDPLRTRYVNQSTGETRMSVAIRELQKSIDSLDRGALFNIIPFSSDFILWLDEGVAGSDQKTRDEAKEFAGKLGANGGTNIYGAVKAAFRDEQVDTIFILSDGEPSVGEELDPTVIRDHIAEWNKHRQIEIHCVAVGGGLQLLEWIAEDSGGNYVKFN